MMGGYPGGRRIPAPFSLPVAVLLAALVSLAASAGSYFPSFYHGWNPKAGCWSTYQITDSRGETAQLTFSVAGEEKEGFWLEVKTVQDGSEGVAAYLVSGDPNDDENILKVRVQETGGPAMEINKPTLERLKREGQQAFGSQATPIGPTVGRLEGQPDEVIEVGGRKLTCHHIRVVGPQGKPADVWLHDEVLPFGLVKLVSGSEQVVLTSFGRGAKSALKGPFTPLTLP
jgi:hypothetical protein